MKKGYEAFEKAGIKINWGFSTPHYEAYCPQRNIIEAFSGLLYEYDPYDKTKIASIKDKASAFYRGVIYVPTPLEYIKDSNAQADVNRIVNELDKYTDKDLASFFYAPSIEFQFISITDKEVFYDDNSYLKQLIRAFKKKEFTFVPILKLFDFVPSTKAVNIFPNKSTELFLSDIDGDGAEEFIGWDRSTSAFNYAKLNLEKFPNRLFEDKIEIKSLGLDKWIEGEDWLPLFGDFNGDGKCDILFWHTEKGMWQVAVSTGEEFVFHPGNGDYTWLKNWAAGEYWKPVIGDFNGDGRDDILVVEPAKGNWQIALSTGTASKYQVNPLNSGQQNQICSPLSEILTEMERQHLLQGILHLGMAQ